MKISIPQPLRSYTDRLPEVEAEGATIADLLQDLDTRHPGIRFRMVDEQDGIRPHIRIFVNGKKAAGLDVKLESGDDVQILQALSGG